MFKTNSNYRKTLVVGPRLHFFFHLQRVGEEQGWYCLWCLGRVTEAEDLCIAMEIEVRRQAHSKTNRLPVLGQREVSPGSGGQRRPAGPQVGGREEGGGRMVLACGSN